MNGEYIPTSILIPTPFSFGKLRARTGYGRGGGSIMNRRKRDYGKEDCVLATSDLGEREDLQWRALWHPTQVKEKKPEAT